MELKPIERKALQHASYTFSEPFSLTLADQSVFLAEQVVRIIPHKRLVAFGFWNGKSVVAKLFYGARHAKDSARDAEGIKILAENHVPSPVLWAQTTSKDKRISVLLFERLRDTQSLAELWQQKSCIASIFPTLQAIVLELATQHVYGILQRDLHFKNFLLSEQKIYTLDGGQIEKIPGLLDRSNSLDNLALFFSQLGVGSEEIQAKLFRFYADSRGWLLKKNDFVELFAAIRRWQQQRWQDYKQKIRRECTQFSSVHYQSYWGMYDRNYDSAMLQDFLKNPDNFLNQFPVHILKNGRSATVMMIVIDNHHYVIKRYNMKDSLHWLRRCLRPTRAARSWELSQQFMLHGIATAKPVAFLEKRFLGLRSQSYFVMEYVDGEHAGDYLQKIIADKESLAGMVKKIAALLRNMGRLHITHGDLKITNILIDKQQQPVIIDLDGTAAHTSIHRLHKAWRKEITRFLENFRDNDTLYQAFQAEFGFTV